MKKKIILLLIITSLFVCLKVSIQKQKMQKNVEEYNAQTLITEKEKNESTEIGENSRITSIQITKTKTGTGPFDKDDLPGNDSSENNNIVRSFDQITWTVESTMALKQNSKQESYKGGILEIQAEIPENCKGLVQWDLDSMAWAEDAEISSDGIKFKAKYAMPSQEITVPGKQTLVLVLKIGGAQNGLEIKPKISMNLYGNTEADKKEIEGDKIIVSASPNYNIKLVQNSELQKKMTIDYGEGNKQGRMYGYGVILQLYNEDQSKGLKGIEYPKDEIKFDINLKLTRSKFESQELEDITNKCTPILWNYKINNMKEAGNINNRTMYWGNSYHKYIKDAPLGEKTNRTYSVFNSGSISMTQNGSKINTIIKDYKFDEIFPKSNYYYASHPHNTIDYTENIGCFSVGYFQIFVPDNQESTIEDRNYYLSVSNTNFNAISSSGISTAKQKKDDDDICTVQHVIYKKGKYEHTMTIRDENYNNPLSSSYEAGDAYSVAGSKISLACKFSMNINNDRDIYGADKFIKFDGNCVEPQIFADGSKYTIKKSSFAGTMTFKVYYVTKKDGTNWINQEEMNNGNIKDMDLYENIEDIPKNKLCIGIFLESESGYLAVSSGDNNTINVLLKVKETAKIGQTYGFTQSTRYWLEELDRSKYSQKILSGYDTYPSTEWNSGNRNYIKTEYSDSGEIVEGTHSGGWYYGQTLLITSAEMSIIKNAINEETNEVKTNYDFSKNEYNVTYKLTPILDNPIDENKNITDIVLKIQDTIPKQMSYVGGTCNYNEPEVNKNEDGTTTLTWYIYGAKVGKEIEPIKYQVHIDELTENGTILNSSAVIEEVPNIDTAGNKIYKIGNKILNKRTSKNSIQVINLSSYSLFKTTQTPIIEINDKMEYKITCINKTDEKLNDFKLLDILPYNGDGRGTEYSGTYRVEKIEIKQINAGNTQVEDNKNLHIFITENKNIRQDITVKDVEIDKEDIWKEISSGETLNKEITGIAIDGSLTEKTKLEVEIYMQTEGNNSGEAYKNLATVQTSKETEAMQTSVISVRTVKRKIEGTVWEDSNKDGIINEGEKLLEGIQLQLIKEDGLPAIDVKNNIIPIAITDENGKYVFKNMKKGSYKVKIVDFESRTQEITQKEVGINKEINSKFNWDGTTDIIEELNNTNSPILTKANVNAGIIYKKIENEKLEEQQENSSEIKKDESNEEKQEEKQKEVKNFNLSINKKVSKITLNEKQKKVKNGKLEKIEIPSKKISNTQIEIEYVIELKNTGNIDGKTQIQEIIPEGLEIVKAENWNQDSGKIYSNIEINAGETKELGITLKWSGGEENFGTKTNIAKIIENKNSLNIQEENLEDNESKAEVIISIKTGIGTKIKVLIIGIMCMIIFLIILMIKKKIINKYIIE